MNGWIKIHRKLTEWEWYDDANTFRVFMHLLLSANHKAKKYHGHDIPAGACVSGLGALSKRLKLSIQQVRTALAKLQSTGEITIKTTNKFSVISITNWHDLQVEQQTNNTQATNDQQTTNNQITPSEECKKERKKEEDIGGADAQDGKREYFWEGRNHRLTKKDFDIWADAYPNIPNLKAELTRADDYYTANPGKIGKIHFQFSSWLRNADEKYRRQENPAGDDPLEVFRGVLGCEHLFKNKPDPKPKYDAWKHYREMGVEI